MNNNISTKNNYTIKHGKKLNPVFFILITLSILIIIFLAGVLQIYIFQKYWQVKYKCSISDSCRNAFSEIFSDESDKSDSSVSSNTSSKNSDTEDNNSKIISPDTNDSKETDYNSLSIEDYCKLCTEKTFGSDNSDSDTIFSQILYDNNNYTVYINIGTYRNQEELNEAAVNASVELYKALYTIYPQKFGSTLFGVYVSGSYIDENGNTTEPDEVMFSWFDKKTLQALNINSLTPDNLQDVVYRDYQPYKNIDIQRD